MKSAGYNPLAIIAEYYREEHIDEAQQLAKSFSYAIFNSNKDTQEAIWKNTATDLFTAMIIAVTHDCIGMDATLNEGRVSRFLRLRIKFVEYRDSVDSTPESVEERMEIFAKVYFGCGDREDYLDADVVLTYMHIGIPEYIPAHIVKKYTGKEGRIDITYEQIHPNEKNINCFSVLNFFKEMVDTVSVTAGKGQLAGAKKADTALDDYFNQRPPLDYAKALYASIKSAGDRTKGSVYINMQSALSIFLQDNIARLTAESDIDIREIGFNTEHPTAVFIGIPTEDRSNHFLALTFITQVFQYLWKLSKHGANKVDREVQFIFDEFGNMPVMDNFDGMVTNCLGAGMAFNIFIQSYNQLKSKYEMDEDTIKDNFANQVFILQVGKDSAEEFSVQLGNKTVVELQRSGTILSMKKSMMENPKERPLLNANELKHLREGEVAILRVAKRTDVAGAAIRNYPILCEYQDNIRIWSKVRIVCNKIIVKRWVRHIPMLNTEEKTPLTASQEYRYWLSEEKRRQGTAFLYRWQYATDDFPNPDEINFFEVFREKGREGIDYRNRVISVNYVKGLLGIQVAEQEQKDDPHFKAIYEMEKESYAKYVNWCSKYLGVDFRWKYKLTGEMTIEEVWTKLFDIVSNMEPPEKEDLIRKDFLGGLNRILLRE
jgi:type IV secretion system protein VirD4